MKKQILIEWVEVDGKEQVSFHAEGLTPFEIIGALSFFYDQASLDALNVSSTKDNLIKP